MRIAINSQICYDAGRKERDMRESAGFYIIGAMVVFSIVAAVIDGVRNARAHQPKDLG